MPDLFDRLVPDDLSGSAAFIERQFPVARVSAESYKERTGKQSQTLTGLGKWWGRKPLVLVRATLLGLLLPATDDPEADRDVFLRLLTMDDEGLWRRKSKLLPLDLLLATLPHLPEDKARELWDPDTGTLLVTVRELRDAVERKAFDQLPYAAKLTYCDRPEHLDGPDKEGWARINRHLGTSAQSLPELVEQLGIRRFGHRPRVGDSFCGGGSVPFEAARIGADAFASDLNPVAGLLTWAALHVVGGGDDVVGEVDRARRDLYARADAILTEWGVEHDENGWRADAFLYCVDAVDPETGYRTPLVPSWVIGEKTKTIARLVRNDAERRYDLVVESGVSDAEMQAAKASGTVRNSALVPPDGRASTPISVLRGDGRGGLRRWINEDLVPRADDVFGERLYAVRFVETYTNAKGEPRTRRHYRTPTEADLAREQRCLDLLRERFEDWQGKGYIPRRAIEEGAKTDEPIRTRGWTHWHHLFTPRQLLTIGLLNALISESDYPAGIKAAMLLGVGRISDWNSRLNRWNPNAANEKSEQTFSNQALNTMYNFASRSLYSLDTTWFNNISSAKGVATSAVCLQDARTINHRSDYWITDPPYADAVKYEEVSEFFLAWYEGQLPALFPDWYTDSKRALAVAGADADFRSAMVACYARLAENMPPNGMQVVMFTHQDAGVWADLSLILWAAGLRVTAAWTISTETDSALKTGNYVQGTVLLVLRRRDPNAEGVFLDELVPAIENEVRRQVDAMHALDDDSAPNFGDADYQLAAYAAALRVITAAPIFEIDPAAELRRERRRGETSPVQRLIEQAVQIACDHLVPEGLDSYLWRTLGPLERFYVKGLEVESHGEHRSGVFQELARGYGASDYTALYASGRANETRLATASELGRRLLGDAGFGASLLRHVLMAVHVAVREEDAARGLAYLRTERPAYWSEREAILGLLDFLARTASDASMPHWADDARAAALVAGAVRNDRV